MPKILLLLVFYLSCQQVSAQQHTSVDSLIQIYLQDPENIKVLENIVEYYVTENLDSLNYYAIRIANIAAEQNNDQLRSKVLISLANGYLNFNMPILADSLMKSLDFGDILGAEMKAQFMLTKGRILKSQKNLSEALTYFYDAIQLIKDFKLNLLLPKAYTGVAAILGEANDLLNCTKYYRYALSEASKNDDIKLQVDICYALCRVYNGGIIVNLDSSVYYGELGMNLALGAGYEFGYIKMLKLVAAPIIRQGQYLKGLKMSQEALTYADRYNFSTKTRYYLVLNQGFSYEKLGQPDSAWIKMQEATEIRPVGIDHWRLKYLILKLKEDYAAALLAFEIYKTKRDSIISSRNTTKLSSIQARNEADLQEREVARLTGQATQQIYQLSQQRYLLITLVLIFVLILTGAVLIYRQKRLKQQQIMTRLELDEVNKRLDIEQQYRESELKALRSQMNPHFIFNALNSIQGYIMTNEKKLAGKYLGKFADLMRIYLDHSQHKTVLLSDEIATLNLYLDLEKLRFEDALNIKINIDSNVDTSLLSIPTLLIQPYVENALKHGLLHKKDDRNLSVSFNYKDGEQILECEIIDDGIGREQSDKINKLRNPNHNSFSISAAKNRITLLNYNSEGKIVVEIVDLYHEDRSPAGTKVKIKIPV